MYNHSIVVIEGRSYRLVPIEPIAAPSAPLTSREREIVELVRVGRVNKQIAGDLGISEHTVSTHLRRVFAKLGVDTRAAMVHAYAALESDARPAASTSR
ncbi:MAG: helix-turn-helix transcriptional regulator [Myxococcota bacterium]